jgi:NADPH-dependent 2,4-dienoyl-CoA reductase/sulfur reductase-like enzyme
MKRVVVIGGGAAGMSASSRVRRLDESAEVTVFESTKMVSHAPCGIPYYVEGLFDDENLFMTYTPEFFRTKRRINVVTETRVTEVDLKSRVVRAEGKGQKYVAEYDYLVIATGASPKILDTAKGDRVFYVHHPAEAKELREKLWSLNRIAVVGAGITGLEMAEALAARGKKVILIHREPYPLNKYLDEDMGKILATKVSQGVEFRPNEAFERAEEGGRIVVTDKGKYEVDGTIVAVGIRPNVDLFKDYIRLGPTGAIETDHHMRTNFREVYAAGDVAQSFNIITGKPDWQPFAPVANKMGFVAGSNIGGHEMRFPGVVGTVITKFNDYFVAKTGLTEREAREHGFKPFAATIESKTRARYYPGAKDIFIRLVMDEATGRLLGGQIIGGEEVLGRIDAVAAMIQKGMTVEEAFFVEMGYLPAISRVWDPLIVAIRQLMKAE